MKAVRRSHTSSSKSKPHPSSSSWIHLSSLIVVSASSPAPDRVSPKSPWSRRIRKHALSTRQWNNLFSTDGKLRDGGVKFLKKARRGGIDPSIRAQVWPFLLGVYDLNSTEAERSSITEQKRAEYEILRRRCRLLSHHDKINQLEGVGEDSKKGVQSLNWEPKSPFSENFSARPSFAIKEGIVKEDQSVFDKAPEQNACEMEAVGDVQNRAVYDKTPGFNLCKVKESRTYREQAVYDKISFSEHNPEEDISVITHVDQFTMEAEVTKGGSVGEDQPVFDKAHEQNAGDGEEKSDYQDQAFCAKTLCSSSCNLIEVSNYGHQTVYDKNSSSNERNVPENSTGVAHVDGSAVATEYNDSESSIEEDEGMPVPCITGGISEPDPEYAKIASLKENYSNRTYKDFTTWWRIIRLDAVRTNADWVIHSPNQAKVSEDKANQSAVAVGLKDYDHLEPCMIYHAARLVALLEAYALYDQEIGYCQGMSDLLSPILAVIEEDHEAFWCFVGFMKKARHNYRLDEVGIRRQLGIVAKIIKSKDVHLYRHLANLQAEDCFFLYRMVVVVFRRELSFEQTMCLWEVMWADQAAIRAGISKSSLGRMRLRAPPTDDLLLYAIAACILQRRKLIIEKYSSMDEIIGECNDMAGQLDVWRLLDHAHDLVVTLHDRI